MEHLDDNAASEFVSGALSPSALRKAEGHLARCRECRALVAALAADSMGDSNAATFRHERISPSQVGELPGRTLSVGDRVGRYLVLSSLGSGGMGVVFAAYDPQLDRKIALKLLRSGIAVSSKDARARLRREAQAIAQLSHPNVVSIYDVGTTDDGDLYIAMEFVEGDTLTTWLNKYPRTWREIIDVFVQAARGLLAAHGVGLLHRDFKPDNVLVGGDGRVRVTDFGLARSLLAPEEAMQITPVMTALNQALTATGTVLGTPRYMPPEQLTGPHLDARSDQFSFCVALYEALYRVHPLRDGTSALMLSHGDEARPPPEGARIPAAISRAVLRGLERERAKRFPSMRSLIDELVPPPRRSPARYAGLAVAGVLLIGGTTAAVVLQQRPPLPVAPENPSVQQLTEELQRTKRERLKLLAELEQARIANAEISVLLDALHKKEAEIDDLTELVAELRASNTKLADAVKRSARLVSRAQEVMFTSALGVARGPVLGCFHEWAERRRGTTDASLVVELTVNSNGDATNARVLSSPDDDAARPGVVRGMGVLEICVSEQVARVKFPPGTEELTLEATAAWSPGEVRLSANVVGRRKVPRGQIELE